MSLNRKEFKRDAVRMALTSGLPRKELAEDLGVGFSTLNKWVKLYGGSDTVPEKEAEPIKEIDRLRRELRIVTEEREVLKKATAFFCGPKAMRFSAIDSYDGSLPKAHIREQQRLSPGSYGRPRMTAGLKEPGLGVGERRAGPLMAENGIYAVRT